MFQLCNRFCLLDQIHDHCECYHPSYLNDAAVGELCNQNMTHEHNLCYMKVLYSLEIGKIKCNCSNACTDVTYDVGVSTSKWPSFVYKVTIFILLDVFYVRFSGTSQREICDETLKWLL